MPLASAALSLDIVKSPFAARSQRVCVRVGDRGAYRLSVALLKDGSPLPMSGLSATLKAVLADGTYAEAACAVDDAASGLVSCTLGGAFASVPGACREAYVEVAQGGSAVGSTGSFELLVERGADLSAGQAKAYASRVDALAERAEGLADGLAATIASADITVSAARLDPGSEPTATVTGSGLAKHVELGIPSATAGVSCEAGPAEMVTVHGAAEDAPLVEACVYGETRQNLWPELGASSGGISISTGDDGTVSVSGTLSAISASAIVYVYNIKPSTTYTVSSDIDVKDLKNGLFVQFDGCTMWLLGSAGNGKSKTFTTPESFSTVTIGIECRAEAGTAYSYSFRVMLNEGDAPAPWSPPGLASVEEVEAKACGLNLFDPDAFLRATGWTKRADGVYAGQGTGLHSAFGKGVPGLPPFSPNGRYVFACRARSAASSGSIASLFLRFVYTDGNENNVTLNSTDFTDIVLTSLSGKTVKSLIISYANNCSIEIESATLCRLDEWHGEQLPGSTTTCPVHLPAAHPYLASLPDGTRDELRVHWDGTAELVARTHMVEVDGSSVAFAQSSSNYAIVKIKVDHDATEMAGQRVMCDAFPTVDGNGKAGCLWAGSGKDILAFSYSEGVASPEAINSIAESNPIHIIYKRAEEAVYYYDGTAWSTTRPARGSLPPLRSSGDPTHVWAATEPASVPAEVSAHVLLEGGKALGAEHDYVRRAVDALAAAQSVSES